MLGKLLKHEFRATSRVLLPLYLALVVISVFANLSVRLLDTSDSMTLNIIAILVLIVFFIGIFAVAIMSVVTMVQRFYRNLLTDEGYLMLTLPVSVHGLVWSKMIVSAVWFIATFLMTGLSVLILTFRVNYISGLFDLIRDFFTELTAYYALNGIAIILESIAVVFLGCAALCLLFYAAMSVGHGFTSHKTLLSVVFFFAFEFAAQLIGTLCVSGLVETGFGIEVSMNVMQSVHAVMGCIALAEIVYCAAFYIITTLSLQRRLNLQ